MRRPCVGRDPRPTGSADGSGAIHAKILPPVRRHARRRGPGCRDRTASARGLAPGPSPRSAAWPTDPDTQDPRIEQGRGRRPMPARQGRETRLARLINHRTTTMETQERAHLVIDAGGQPQRRIPHPPASATARPSPATSPPAPRNPPRSPAPVPDAPAPPAPPERRLRPDRRIRKPRLRRPPGQRRTQCVCMHVHFHSRFRSNHPPCDPNPQIRKAASIPAPPHKRRKPATAVPSGRADPAPPVRSRRP